MSFAVQTKAKTEEAAVFLASSILKQLNSGKQVLFFVTGGSSMAVAVRTAELLREHPHQNLTVTLTDERYGPIDHFNSNYFQLMEKGFDLPQAKMIPILIDDDQNITTEKFNTVLRDRDRRAYRRYFTGIRRNEFRKFCLRLRYSRFFSDYHNAQSDRTAGRNGGVCQGRRKARGTEKS